MKFGAKLGVPKPGCLQFLRRSALLHSFAPFCALLRSFADLRLRSFALICARSLRSFVCFCKKSPPPPPGASDSPFPSPEQKKNAKRPPSLETLIVSDCCWSEGTSKKNQSRGRAHSLDLILSSRTDKFVKENLHRGSRRGFRRPNSLCRCWFSQQNAVHKEFRGGGV